MAEKSKAVLIWIWILKKQLLLWFWVIWQDSRNETQPVLQVKGDY
jgi:hypothetical protein